MMVASSSGRRPTTALTDTITRERGEVTHHLLAAALDMSPLATEMIRQALRRVVHAYHDIIPAGASLDEVAVGNEQAGVDGA